MSVSFGYQALFRWKGKSCLDGDVSSCYIGHGDILVMDGQCRDEFLHCTDPGLEQERINVTFRWIRQHTTSCPLWAGVVCCLPMCAQGSSATVMGNWEFSAFGVCGSSLGSCVYGGCWFCWCFPSYSQGLGYGGMPVAGHAFLSGGRRAHYLRDSRGVSWITQKGAFMFRWRWSDSGKIVLYMLALMGQPSLRGRDACMVLRARGASWRICRQDLHKTSFSPLFLFLLSRLSGFFMEWGGSLASLDWSC